MRLIFFRHGIALEREEAQRLKMPDEQRPLTKQGIERSHKMAQTLASFEKGLKLIVHSPFLRAKQTADVASDYFVKAEIRQHPGLAPAADPAELMRLIGDNSDSDKILVVGHEPNISIMVSQLLGMASPDSILIKKASLCGLDFDQDGNTSLRYLIQPKQFLSMTH